MLTRLNDAAVDVFVRFTLALQALFTPAPAGGVLGRRVAARGRAMSFFEYAILAAIVISVGIIFRRSLGGLLSSMWSTISGTWSEVRTTA